MSDIYPYILEHISPEPEVLQELQRQTTLRVVNPRMCSGHLQGRLLGMLTTLIKPRRVLELGTFTGYATTSIAMELGDGAIITTIEKDDELEEFAAEFFELAGVKNRVEQRIGDAMEVMPQLAGTLFDMVFIDADKRSYKDYYDTLFTYSLVGSGSLILADNTLWDGKVVEELKRGDTQTLGVMEFNDYVAQDNRVEKVILPLRDGLTLIRVK